jgi:hypothetical protein
MDSAQTILLKKRAAPILSAEQEGLWWLSVIITQGDEVAGSSRQWKAGFLESGEYLLDLVSRYRSEQVLGRTAAGAGIA